MRLLVERVEVRGWQVDIHLRIPLDEPPTPGADSPDERPSGPPARSGGRGEGDRGRGRPQIVHRPVSSEDRFA